MNIRSHSLILLLLTSVVCIGSPAQTPEHKNKLIENIVSEISPKNIRHIIERLSGFGTRHTLSDTSGTTQGIGAARRWIKSEFESYARQSHGRLSAEFQEYVLPPSARVRHSTSVVNVVATLQSAHPQDFHRILIVSGHYDSRASDVLDSASAAPGADDDGSGTALVMELARVFSKYEFESTIMFVAFAGEEQGLLGSAKFAETASKNNWNIEAVLNNDIVGGIRGGNGEIESTYVRLFSEAYSPFDTGAAFRQRNSLGLENDGPSRSLARYIKEISSTYVPDLAVRLIYRRDRFLRGGDQLSFHDRGFAAVRFTEANEDFNHQHQNVRTVRDTSYGDLPQYVNFAYCAKVARVNGAALASLALAPSAPAGAVIVTRNLEYGTSLHWHMNSESDNAGYRVIYRSTSSPKWQFSEFTADTIINLKVSKDDYLFGVQAVDKEGNYSLPAIPLPGR